MKKIILFLISFFMFMSTPSALSVPSRNAILIDQESGRVLYSKNINDRHLIASTTKIMTAVLAIESGKLDDIVTITDEMTKSYGSGIYIKEGEKISLRNLVYGLLLRSGNDAALSIEIYLGGHDKFINLMNQKARDIGMENTIFVNSSGLDDDGGNYSTVYDMALLMSYANNIFEFREIDSTKKIVVKTNKNVYSWINKNKLLFQYKYGNGGKTGYTEKAKRTLVTSASKNNVNLIAVTFNDKDDFNTHKKLYEYGFNNYKNYLILNKNKFKVKDNKNLYIKNNYYYIMTNNERDNININIKLYEHKKEDKSVGYVEVFYKNKSIHKEPIYKK